MSSFEAERRFFVEAYDSASRIADQNGRAEQAQEAFTGDDKGYLPVVLSAIENEQEQTIEELAQIPHEPWADLGARYAGLLDSRADTEERLRTITDEEDARKTHVLAMDALAKQLAPTAPDEEITEITARRMAAIDNLNRLGLQDRILTINEELVALDGLYEVAGQAWPVPQVYRPEASTDTPAIKVEFELPVEPSCYEYDSSRAGELRQFLGRTDAASMKMAVYLLENEERILTIEEIHNAVYPDDPTIGTHLSRIPKNELSLRNKVAALLRQEKTEDNAENSGNTVRSMLSDIGYVVKNVGVRIIDAATNKLAPHTKPRTAYFVILKEREIFFDSLSTEKLTAYYDESGQLLNPELVAELTGATLIGRVEDANDAQDALPAPQTPDNTAVIEEEATSPVGSEVTEAPEPEVAAKLANARRKPVSKREQKLQDFANTVHEAADKLYQAGVLPVERNGVLPNYILYQMSNKLGTQTARERLHKAGLLKAELLDTDTELSAATIVLMELFNTNRQFLSSSSAVIKKQIVETVERVLNDYYASLAKERSVA